MEIAKYEQNRSYFPVYVEIFGLQFTQLFYFHFFIYFQEDDEYVVAWRVSQVQEALEKLGYRPCAAWCERQFSEV